ncbi:MAG TPA: response regulator transcription factor [Nocardioides sp.]|nr:response regulator transcription factor [Nocardioides sp.]
MSVPAPSPIRILVADDFAVVREGVKALLERQADLRVTVFAVDGMDAVEKATKGDVDLVILDIAMPKLTGLQAVREIARRRPDLPILLLSMHADEQYFFEAVAAGAAGYVLKQQADRDIIAACRAVPCYGANRSSTRRHSAR